MRTSRNVTHRRATHPFRLLPTSSLFDRSSLRLLLPALSLPLRSVVLPLWSVVLLISAFCLPPSADCQQPTDEQRALNAAEELYYNRQWKQAIEALESFVKDYPKSAELSRVYLRLGQAYASLDNDKAARQAYTKVLERNPDDSYASQAVSMWGNLYVQRYQYPEAVQMCREAIRLYPNTAAAEMAHYLMGVYLYSDAKLQEAEQAYRGFIAFYPKSVYKQTVFRQLINLLIQEEKNAEAEQLLDKHLAESPGDSGLIDQLAEVYIRQQRHGDAIRLLERALTARPNDPTLLETLGSVYAEQGDSKRALEIWMRMADAGGATYDTYQRLGYVLKENGLYEESAKQYEAAIRLQPTFAFLYTQLADIYKIQGDLKNALGVYVRALVTLGASYGGREQVVTAIGELYSEARQQVAYSDAIAAIRAQFGDQLETNPVGVLSLAELHFQKGEMADSLRYFERLAQLQPDAGATLNRYAEQLAAKDDAANAVAFYETADRLFPNTSDTARRLVAKGESLMKLRRWDDALIAFRNALARDPQRQTVRNADALLARTLLEGKRNPTEALAQLAIARQQPALSSATQRDLALLMAEAHISLGAFDQAKAILENSSDNAKVAFLEGDVLLYQGKFEEAANVYLRVATEYPASEEANDALERVTLIRENADAFGEGLTLYVNALRAQGRGNVEEAMTICRALLKGFPNAPLADDTNLLLGELAVQKEDWTTAIQAYGAAAESKGGLSGEALLSLGNLYLERGNVNKAIESYERLLKETPTGAFALEAREQLKSLMEIR